MTYNELPTILDTEKMQENALDFTIDPKSLIEQIWADKATFVKLSQKGHLTDINGKKLVIKHNKVLKKAVLQISEQDNNSGKTRFVIIDNAYKASMPDNFQKPTIDQTPEIIFDQICEWDNINNILIVDADNQEKETLEDFVLFLIDIIDNLKNVRAIKIKTKQDLSSFIKLSLLNPKFRALRINKEEELLLYNYTYKEKHKEKRGESTQMEEAETTISLQKHIATKKGIIAPKTNSDIQVFISRKDLSEHIEKITDEEFFSLWEQILTQISNTREQLAHLVPIQPNESISIEICSEKTIENAFYIQYISERKQYISLNHKSFHGRCYFPPTRTKFAPETKQIKINTYSLSAEIRHHIHYLITEKLELNPESKRQHTPTWKAITEIIDELYQLKDFIQLAKTTPHKELEQILRRKKKMWEILSTLGDIKNHELTGHKHIAYTMLFLATQINIHYPNLSEEKLKEIEKIIFEFLAFADIDKEILGKTLDIEKIKERLSYLENFIELPAPSSWIINPLFEIVIKSYFGQDSILGNEYIQNTTLQEKTQLIKKIKEHLSLIDKYKSKINTLFYFKIDQILSATDIKDDPVTLIIESLVDCLRDTRDEIQKILSEIHPPFHQTPEKTYFNQLEYYTDPEVIFAEIQKRISI